MAFNQGMLEEIVDWCRDSPELEATNREARSYFFGDEDKRPVKYWPGTGELSTSSSTGSFLRASTRQRSQ